MGKGSRNRKNREIATAQFEERKKTKEYQTVYQKEIRKGMAQLMDTFYRDETSVILWCLHEVYGFGPKRLERFVDLYNVKCEELRSHYLLQGTDLPFVTRKLLKDIGLNLEDEDLDLSKGGVQFK